MQILRGIVVCHKAGPQSIIPDDLVLLLPLLVFLFSASASSPSRCRLAPSRCPSTVRVSCIPGTSAPFSSQNRWSFLYFHPPSISLLNPLVTLCVLVLFHCDPHVPLVRLPSEHLVSHPHLGLKLAVVCLSVSFHCKQNSLSSVTAMPTCSTNKPVSMYPVGLWPMSSQAC